MDFPELTASHGCICQIVHIELFIDERIDRLIDLIDDVLSWSLIDLGPLGLYEEIYNAHAPCTWLVHVSHA